MWINRELEHKLIETVKRRPVVLLTGARQTGKSSLLKHTFPKASYVTLDDPFSAIEAQENPTAFINRFNDQDQVIIDEIQYAPNLFRTLKISVDENRRKYGKWILTGSQHFLLMKELSESLAGRISVLELGSLNAAELNASPSIKTQEDQLWKGGYPELWAEDLPVNQFFIDYVNSYLERDLKDFMNIYKLQNFRSFLTLLSMRAAQLLNITELSKKVGVSERTIKSWITALEATGIIAILPPYFENLGKRMIKAPKLFFRDNGLLAHFLNIKDYLTLERSGYLGHLWENFVFTEFIKGGLKEGRDLFYFRDSNGVEIDFIIHAGQTIHMVEAKYSELPDPKKQNFSKLTHLFKQEVNSVLACRINDTGFVQLKDQSLYNPLFGNNWHKQQT